jgi:hypothetical protein
MSIDTDPQQQEAASPQMLVGRSFFTLKLMFTKRMLAAAYVVLLFSLVTFWFGLHSLPKGVLFALFFVGFFAAGFTVIYPWANYRRTNAQNLQSRLLESRNEL